MAESDSSRILDKPTLIDGLRNVLQDPSCYRRGLRSVSQAEFQSAFLCETAEGRIEQVQMEGRYRLENNLESGFLGLPRRRPGLHGLDPLRIAERRFSSDFRSVRPK